MELLNAQYYTLYNFVISLDDYGAVQYSDITTSTTFGMLYPTNASKTVMFYQDSARIRDEYYYTTNDALSLLGDVLIEYNNLPYFIYNEEPTLDLMPDIGRYLYRLELTNLTQIITKTKLNKNIIEKLPSYWEKKIKNGSSNKSINPQPIKNETQQDDKSRVVGQPETPRVCPKTGKNNSGNGRLFK